MRQIIKNKIKQTLTKNQKNIIKNIKMNKITKTKTTTNKRAIKRRKEVKIKKKRSFKNSLTAKKNMMKFIIRKMIMITIKIIMIVIKNRIKSRGSLSNQTIRKDNINITIKMFMIRNIFQRRNNINIFSINNIMIKTFLKNNMFRRKIGKSIIIKTKMIIIKINKRKIKLYNV